MGHHTVDTEGDIASDNVDTINGGVVPGQKVSLCAANTDRTVVFIEGGNLQMSEDAGTPDQRTLDSSHDIIEFTYTGTNWKETSWSNNGN
jgi:hypothetical protein